jgi:hypothetical protein
MKKIILSLLLIFGCIQFADAQCKSFVKKKCKPALAPFVHNGQMNNTMLRPGDKAELLLTFSSGQEYRVMVCAMDNLGEVNFKVMDSDRNVIYTNEKDKKKNYFDFKVASTQQLIVEIEAPDKKTSNGLVPEGCVSVLVGFQGAKK